MHHLLPPDLCQSHLSLSSAGSLTFFRWSRTGIAPVCLSVSCVLYAATLRLEGLTFEIASLPAVTQRNEPPRGGSLPVHFLPRGDKGNDVTEECADGQLGLDSVCG